MARGVTPAKGVLIVVLVGALYMVGKKVNPPPAGPPEQAPPPAASTETKPAAPTSSGLNSPEKMAVMMKDQQIQKDRAAKQEQFTRDANGGKSLTPEDQISPAYFTETKMGASGLTIADADAAKRKRIAAEVTEKMDAYKKVHPTPSNGERPGEAPVPPISAQPSPNK